LNHVDNEEDLALAAERGNRSQVELESRRKLHPGERDDSGPVVDSRCDVVKVDSALVLWCPAILDAQVIESRPGIHIGRKLARTPDDVVAWTPRQSFRNQ
jgi:hypothetical protein